MISMTGVFTAVECGGGKLDPGSSKTCAIRENLLGPETDVEHNEQITLPHECADRSG